MVLTNPVPVSVGNENRATCQWTMYQDEDVFPCHVVVCREADGFSVHTANLPGASSQGQTVSEAFDNIREALLGVLLEYIASGETIPWSDAVIDGEVECEKWILVNARLSVN